MTKAYVDGRGRGPTKSARLSDVAYERILEHLFDRRLPAGSFLSQNELVRLIGVPVGPLRDALRVLETEGVLKVHPRSGIRFVKPGLELTRVTYQFRTIVERAAVRVFAETAEDGKIDSIAQRHERLAASIRARGLNADNIGDTEAVEDALHNSVVATLQNPLVDASYRRIYNYMRLLRLERNMTAPLALKALDEHLRILDACRQRDADKAEEELVRHFNLALNRILGM